MKKIQRKKKIESLPLPSEDQIRYLSSILVKQIDTEIFKKKYAPAAAILKLVGAGVFLVASFAVPNLPKVLKPFWNEEEEYELWKRFNIPYLKRTLHRLEKEKLVEIGEEKGRQIVKITDGGKRRILKYALEEIEIKKPRVWDGTWRLVSYDLPKNYSKFRDILYDYLRAWGFYPLHKSVLLHAYPCEKEVEFLREYLGLGKYVRIFKVAKIENDGVYRKFFGV